MTARAAVRPLKQPGQNPHRCDIAGKDVNDRCLHLDGLGTGYPDDTHQATIRLKDAIDARTLRIRPRLTIG